ncbi:2-dehydro-3-deoxyphosphogluconate aldolase/(4S)-4-hydroxy-2-oxoglutarate aldolase [Mucilaginibacter frigoritolerans]|jgi:2-dehydro-3-deoxyphosphogluconate aldolase / (4S)-4-hydroxy-2-oxoglutarate aldolase|uniref:2-dehydro-3-deoxyphosphogluconate aldolase/(4S)-4-hydroxy-2-oxoglutarate aldolase n=1 Tax=Mucilaginibacter frigoritolerans TaxID=652788 RepID=A0A562TQQ9_9SPHI|nr:bifunctional 4-hydroxy-2-oxoglutarate aldolase/2-dehydro-3-deoxy-phosphogluconate aldolase [Mucilaginibacter frigoritolerans]TWI95568.1 2-dehydro-3-deoxyphosphogluconate aldolase/(4S)-4-hydroxy-2-oxoglutarate aldolase [Mucilaginibacter frigoritolerans]
MKKKKIILNAIIDQGTLPLFFHSDAEVTLETTRALYKGGVRVLEYTNRGPEALENFKLLNQVRLREMPDLYLGIGTIKTEEEAIAFIEAGTDFIVAPIINPEVSKLAREHHLLWIPGCMTPTEIFMAQKHKAALIKIFPANILGHEFISSISSLFPGQLFMPTGGVEINEHNLRSWFKAGVCAVGMGSKLIGQKIMDEKSYGQLTDDTVKALQLIKVSR